MIKGYYEDGLQEFRTRIRNSLQRNGLTAQERYETVSSHITIARVKQPLHDPSRLLNYIEQAQDFGSMTVHSIELSFHNWYDTKKTMLLRVTV